MNANDLDDLRRLLPALYATEETPAESKKILAKWFGLGSRWAWYAVEFDGNDICFGYVVSGFGSDCDEWGYFSLLELESAPSVERDRFFRPCTFGALEL